MRKIIIIIIISTFLLLITGCNNNQNISGQEELINNNLSENNENRNTEDNNLNNNGTEELKDWLVINIGESNGAYTGNSILIELSDILDKNYKMIETNEILNYYNDVLKGTSQYLLNSISIDGSKFLLNYSEEVVLDLRKEELKFGESVYQSYKKDFNKKFFLTNDMNYIYWEDYNNGNYDSENYIEFYNTQNTLVNGPLVSYDNKKIVSVEKNINNEYFLAFYNIEDKTIYDHVQIKEINSDNVYLSQWHNSNNILVNVDYKAYKYNIETKELIELGDYLFRPIMSFNEDYILYFKPQHFYDYLFLIDIEDYGETGIFVRDLSSNVDYKIEGEVFNKYEMYEFYPSRIIHTSIDYSKLTDK